MTRVCGLLALPLTALLLAGCHSTTGSVASTAGNPAPPVSTSAASSEPSLSELRGFPLHLPLGVAVDPSGNLYVTDYVGNTLWKLPAGSATPHQLAAKYESEGGTLHGFNSQAIAAGKDGTLYVADRSYEGSRIVTVVESTSSVVALPFTGLRGPAGIAVDDAGAVYVADYDNDTGKGRVLKLTAGDPTPTELPFTRLQEPTGVAVDSAGTVYVADRNHSEGRVLKLAPGAADATDMLAGTGFYELGGIAVDAAGSIYLSGHGTGKDQVLKLAAGANEPTALPFTGLLNPRGVAVDATGNVYVVDQGEESRRGTVWKLAPE